jgi:hypothetical protein
MPSDDAKKASTILLLLHIHSQCNVVYSSKNVLQRDHCCAMTASMQQLQIVLACDSKLGKPSSIIHIYKHLKHSECDCVCYKQSSPVCENTIYIYYAMHPADAIFVKTLYMYTTPNTADAIISAQEYL